MSHRLTLVDITDDEDDIATTLTPDDAQEWGRFIRGLLYGTAASIAFWVVVGALIWAVWPR